MLIPDKLTIVIAVAIFSAVDQHGFFADFAGWVGSIAGGS